MSMRDAFWEKLYTAALGDERICIVTGDMSAPGLDNFRARFPSRYINVGIAEYSMILTACGLAKEGMRPYCYAIMPFASLRPYEAIKSVVSIMDIPITIVGVGSGFGYSDSGPTHHAIEDLAIMRILPHMTVLNCSDNATAENAATMSLYWDHPLYVRLDREDFPNIHTETKIKSLDVNRQLDYWGRGIFIHVHHRSRVIVTTGNMVHTALDVAEKGDIGVIEVYKFPTNAGDLKNEIGGKNVYVLEENNAKGGLLAEICESVGISLKSIHHSALCVQNGYGYIYGGRNSIQKHHGLDKESVLKWIQLD